MDAVAQVSWSGFFDAASGIQGYSVVYGAALPPSCDKGTLAYKGAATTFRHVGLDPKLTLFYRICAHDGAGNLSVGVVEVAAPRQATGDPR